MCIIIYDLWENLFKLYNDFRGIFLFNKLTKVSQLNKMLKANKIS